MFGKKKEEPKKELIENKIQELPNKNRREDIEALGNITRYVNEKKNELVEEELGINKAIIRAKKSYQSVIADNSEVCEEISQFNQDYARISEMTNVFRDVISDVSEVSAKAKQNMQQQMGNVGQVEERFGEIEQIYNVFQEQFIEIREAMQSIVKVANQTNLLALNASIEAAFAYAKAAFLS